MGESVLLLCGCDADFIWNGFWFGLGVGGAVDWSSACSGTVSFEFLWMISGMTANIEIGSLRLRDGLFVVSIGIKRLRMRRIGMRRGEQVLFSDLTVDISVTSEVIF